MDVISNIESSSDSEDSRVDEASDEGDDASVSSSGVDDSDVDENDDDEEEEEGNTSAQGNKSVAYLHDFAKGQVVYEDDLQYIAAEVAAAHFEVPSATPSLLTSMPAPAGARRAVDSCSSSEDDEDSFVEEEEVVPITEGAAEKNDSDSDASDADASAMEVSNASKSKAAKGKARRDTKTVDYSKEGGALDDMLAEDEEEGPASGAASVPMTKHESLEEPLVSTEADINDMRPDDELVLCGEVKSFIPEEGAVVIQSYHTTSPLNEGSLLCCVVPKVYSSTASAVIPSKAAGTRIAATAVPPEKSEVVVLGRIAELFGPLFAPFYVIRYANSILPTLVDSISGMHDASSGRRNGTSGNASSGGAAGGGGKKNRKRGKGGKGGKSNTDITPDGTIDQVNSNSTSTSEAAIAESEVVAGVDGIDIPQNSNEDVVETEKTIDKPTEFDKRRELYAKIGRIPTSTQVFCIQRCATLVQTDLLKSISGKGSDASNMFDEEVGGSEVEYSDDEAEQKARAERKRLLKSKRPLNQEPVSSGRTTTSAVVGDRGKPKGSYSSRDGSNNSSYRGGPGYQGQQHSSSNPQGNNMHGGAHSTYYPMAPRPPHPPAGHGQYYMQAPHNTNAPVQYSGHHQYTYMPHQPPPQAPPAPAMPQQPMYPGMGGMSSNPYAPQYPYYQQQQPQQQQQFPQQYPQYAVQPPQAPPMPNATAAGFHAFGMYPQVMQQSPTMPQQAHLQQQQQQQYYYSTTTTAPTTAPAPPPRPPSNPSNSNSNSAYFPWQQYR